MRVELSSFVERDLEEIADWIAEDNPRRAVTFIQEIREAFRRIGEGPLHYQLRPDIGEDARLAVARELRDSVPDRRPCGEDRTRRLWRPRPSVNPPIGGQAPLGIPPPNSARILLIVHSSNQSKASTILLLNLVWNLGAS